MLVNGDPPGAVENLAKLAGGAIRSGVGLRALFFPVETWIPGEMLPGLLLQQAANVR